MAQLALHIVTALPAEAKPLSTHYSLQRIQPDRGFPVYRNGGICLIVSGPGKANAAAATAFLHALSGCPEHAIWINLGIAGHADLAIGEGFLAERICDTASGHNWETERMSNPPCPVGTLETLDQADFDYQRDGAFDMEAAGFYQTAIRFVAPERICCLKIISDNRQNPGHGISGKTVRRLIENKLPLLDRLIGTLNEGHPT